MRNFNRFHYRNITSLFRKNEYVPVTILLAISGLVSFYIVKHPFLNEIVDNDFKVYVIIFFITSLVTIIGIDSILQLQKNRLAIKTLKILNYGYDVHNLFASTMNFLTEINCINYNTIDPIFHNHYQTKRGQIIDQRKSYKEYLKKKHTHIKFINNYKPKDFYIKEINLSNEVLSTRKRNLEELYNNMIKKYALSLKIDSEILLDIVKLIQIIDNSIWCLNRYIEDPSSTKKKIRVLISSHRLLYSVGDLMKLEGLFYSSEIDFDNILLGDNSSNLNIFFEKIGD
jgi:hypothetical protein